MNGRGSEVTPVPLTAAEQARLQGAFIASYMDDQQFRSDGGTTFYAIDTSVLIFLVNPLMSAMPSPGSRRSGMAAIFEDDPEGPVGVLAQHLAEFLLTELQPEGPLLIPPPLDGQVFDWQNKLTKETELATGPIDAATRKRFPRLEARARELRKTLGSSEELNEVTEEALADLLRLTLLRDGTRALGRLRRLFEQRRILVVATASAEDLPQVLRGALSRAADSPRNRLMDLIRTSEWRQVLSRLAPSRVRARSFDDKPTALARLEEWNSRLLQKRPSAETRPVIRVVLLTGDTLLLQPRHPTRANDLTEVEREADRFRATFLRHPRSFLSRLPMLRVPQSLQSADQQPPVLAGHFLDLWANWRQSKSDEEQSEVAEEIKAQWHRLLRASALRYAPSEITDEDNAEWKSASISLIKKKQREWKNDIERLTDEYWEQCFYFATQGQVIFGGRASYRANPRNGPPIFLGSWHITADFIDNLLKWTTADKFDIDLYQSGIESLGNARDFKDENDVVNRVDANYAYYLAHAALFAGRGDWQLAAKVAAHARGRLPGEECPPGAANGREAFYLEAFALRHAAGNSTDLDGLHLLLERASEIGQDESEAARKRGLPIPDCVPIRYETEALAIRLSRWLFERFGAEHSGSPNVAELSELALAAALLLERTEVLLQESRAGDASPTRRRRTEALEKLRLRILVNLLAMTTYADLSIENSDIQKWISSAEIYLSVGPSVEESSAARKIAELSPFGRFVLDCARIHISKNENEKHSMRVKLREQISESDLEALVTFPYDRGENGRIRWMFHRALGAN